MNGRKHDGLSRRELMRGAVGLAATSGALGLAGSVLKPLTRPVYAQAKKAPAAAKALVVEIVNPAWCKPDGEPDAKVIREMINEGLVLLTGKNGVADAWRCFVSPKEKVGLKFNSMSFDFMRTNAPVASAVMEGLQDAGIKRKRMCVAEGSRRVDVKGCMKPDLKFGSEVEVADRTTRLTAFIRTQVDCLINLPDLKNHNRAGVTCALKNLSHSMSIIAQPSNMHDNNCNPYVAVVNSMEPVRTKRRLTICTAFRGVFAEGPSPKKRSNQWVRNSVILATDPVAMDRVALELIQEARKAHGKPDLFKTGSKPVHIATAAEMGLGVGDLDAIDWKKVEA